MFFKSQNVHNLVFSNLAGAGFVLEAPAIARFITFFISVANKRSEISYSHKNLMTVQNITKYSDLFDC